MKLMSLELNEEAWKRKWEQKHKELERDRTKTRQ